MAERPDLRGQPDPVVSAAAWAEGRYVVAENVGDYRRLSAEASSGGTADTGVGLHVEPAACGLAAARIMSQTTLGAWCFSSQMH